MNYEIKINKNEVLKKYKYVIDIICSACDWKSTFDPEEIVDIICCIIEGKESQIVEQYQTFIEDTKIEVANDLAKYVQYRSDQKDYYGLDTTSIPT